MISVSFYISAKKKKKSNETQSLTERIESN